MERMGKNTDDMEIIGASENNLKHIDVTIPKGKLVLFVGASGSGKKKGLAKKIQRCICSCPHL